MKNTDVIIIGAGAAGLMAAYTLVKAGKTVTLLEARNRIGGRIHTISKPFSFPVELGAEFVHGDLPVTLGLLNEAKISYNDVSFEMWQYHNGKIEQSEEFVEGWDAFLQKVNQLQHDIPLHYFLEDHFADGRYAKMRRQVENYVAGYDTADVRDVSTFALRNEWNHEDEDAQHRLNSGYGTLIDYLANTCRKAGNDILLNTVAKEVILENENAMVITSTGSVYEADKVIVALPLGVLQSPPEAEGAVQFSPHLPEQASAINNIGFGSIIKILLEFDEPFWETDAITQATGADLFTMGFLFCDEAIPTFWTQAPKHSPLLTGWLGGLPALEKKDTPPETILEQTLASLSPVFKTDTKTLKEKLVAWEVINWTAKPFTRGSYAYDKVESPAARKLLQQPVKDTLYFTGEYLYDGPAMGTVEAALTSGKNVAEGILKT